MVPRSSSHHQTATAIRRCARATAAGSRHLRRRPTKNAEHHELPRRSRPTTESRTIASKCRNVRLRGSCNRRTESFSCKPKQNEVAQRPCTVRNALSRAHLLAYLHRQNTESLSVPTFRKSGALLVHCDQQELLGHLPISSYPAQSSNPGPRHAVAPALACAMGVCSGLSATRGQRRRCQLLKYDSSNSG